MRDFRLSVDFPGMNINNTLTFARSGSEHTTVIEHHPTPVCFREYAAMKSVHRRFVRMFGINRSVFVLRAWKNADEWFSPSMRLYFTDTW
jgi:hypothetical protein